MKKLFILSAIMLICLSCNRNTTLVAYFSATGTTKAVAEQLASAAEADLFEIQPAVAYSEADLNWHDSLSRSSVEMADPSSRPAVAGKVKDIGKYETVYIGFPIWWYTAPAIINTFIEENNLGGKNVKFFATSGGSDIAKAVTDLKAAYPKLNIAGGALLNGASAKEIESFMNSIYITPKGLCDIKVLSDETKDGVRTIKAENSNEVCSSQTIVSVKDGVIVDAQIVGGCPGNTVGVAVLVKGLKVEDAISKIEGIRCGSKPTSCPDQLSKVLRLF